MNSELTWISWDQALIVETHSVIVFNFKTNLAYSKSS